MALDCTHNLRIKGAPPVLPILESEYFIAASEYIFESCWLAPEVLMKIANQKITFEDRNTSSAFTRCALEVRYHWCRCSLNLD